ncbi:sensor histidine kinase [Paenibacillus sp. 79R4]|uniref:sensor histidine kinase n=1 Tax=Paenibacillus sp. 79R4 TaxID=2212847 RepID=UPI0015BDC2CB|nr:sensor histidine kinase [Paenibacillus sp. 79R4]NWL86079.1 sensor histidine kinase [Paenibacillus sp. 79R4]
MLQLLPFMIEKIGIIVTAAFLLSQMKSFRQIVQGEHKTSEKLKLTILFGTFGIISNYTGIEIHHSTIAHHNWHWLASIGSENAIANTRVMGVFIGGLLGGPAVGIGSGLIAGLHRYSLGGFTAAACALSTVLAGATAGYIGKWLGMTLEAVQMIIILIMARPFANAWELVQLIGLPMIIGNGFGTLLFVFIIQSVLNDKERTRAFQTNRTFQIAEQTLPFFRQGLNPDSCKEISKIILLGTDADAVAITDDNKPLSHVGVASDHHAPLEGLATKLTKKVLEQGVIHVARSKKDIHCFQADCPLQAAIVIPLKVHGTTVGSLKMYFTRPDKLTEVQQELAEGLANLFSTQLELAQAEQQSKLLKDAEIRALQAQIHPHFFFNAINTISALCRTDVERARELLIDLSNFYRSNLQGARQLLIPLDKEIEHVEAYLSLEQARFPNKYQIVWNIRPGLEKVLLPPFSLQPLVENAIHHAFTNIKENRKMTISIDAAKESMNIVVEDNGTGINSDKMRVLGEQTVDSQKGTGTAIFNITERLEGIYNGRASLRIQSEVGKGTIVTMSIPLDHTEVV